MPPHTTTLDSSSTGDAHVTETILTILPSVDTSDSSKSDTDDGSAVDPDASIHSSETIPQTSVAKASTSKPEGVKQWKAYQNNCVIVDWYNGANVPMFCSEGRIDTDIPMVDSEGQALIGSEGKIFAQQKVEGEMGFLYVKIHKTPPNPDEKVKKILEDGNNFLRVHPFDLVYETGGFHEWKPGVDHVAYDRMLHSEERATTINKAAELFSNKWKAPAQEVLAVFLGAPEEQELRFKEWNAHAEEQFELFSKAQGEEAKQEAKQEAAEFEAEAVKTKNYKVPTHRRCFIVNWHSGEDGLAALIGVQGWVAGQQFGEDGNGCFDVFIPKKNMPPGLDKGVKKTLKYHKKTTLYTVQVRPKDLVIFDGSDWLPAVDYLPNNIEFSKEERATAHKKFFELKVKQLKAKLEEFKAQEAEVPKKGLLNFWKPKRNKKNPEELILVKQSIAILEEKLKAIEEAVVPNKKIVPTKKVETAESELTKRDPVGKTCAIVNWNNGIGRSAMKALAGSEGEVRAERLVANGVGFFDVHVQFVPSDTDEPLEKDLKEKYNNVLPVNPIDLVIFDGTRWLSGVDYLANESRMLFSQDEKDNNILRLNELKESKSLKIQVETSPKKSWSLFR